MCRKIVLWSLVLILIPVFSWAYLVSESRYFENESRFKPSSIGEIKKMPTAFIGEYVILRTKIKEVSLDKRSVVTTRGLGEHFYLRLVCYGMANDYEDRIEIFIDPDHFDMTIGEISKRLLPIKNKLIFLYAYIQEPVSYSFTDAQISVYAIRAPNERIPNIPKEKSKAAMSKLIKEGPEMLNMVNKNNGTRENDSKLREILGLIHELQDEDRKNINIQVVEAFMQFKYSSVLPHTSYKNDWRQSYQKILNSGNSEATPMLLRILSDHQPQTRLYAANILGKIGDKRALNDLKRLTLKENEKDRKVRREAAKAYESLLSRFGLEDESSNSVDKGFFDVEKIKDNTKEIIDKVAKRFRQFLNRN